MYTAIILAGAAALFAGFLSFVEGNTGLGYVLCLAGVLTLLTGVFAMWFNDDSPPGKVERPSDDR